MDTTTVALVMDCLPHVPDTSSPAAALRACLLRAPRVPAAALVDLLRQYGQRQAWGAAYDVISVATEAGLLEEVVAGLKAAGEEQLLVMMLVSAQSSAAAASNVLLG
jgi:hypothetical protein